MSLQNSEDQWSRSEQSMGQEPESPGGLWEDCRCREGSPGCPRLAPFPKVAGEDGQRRHMEGPGGCPPEAAVPRSPP